MLGGDSIIKKIDDYALIGFPSYLLVAIITSSLIIGVFSFSLMNMINNSKNEIIKKEIEKIINEAENMFEYADTGSLVSLHVDFPDSLRFVVFGDIPMNGANLPNDKSLDEKTSNNYYYVLEDNSILSFSSHTRFSSNNTDEICILKKGSYNLKLELVNYEGKTYVKIYH